MEESNTKPKFRESDSFFPDFSLSWLSDVIYFARTHKLTA